MKYYICFILSQQLLRVSSQKLYGPCTISDRIPTAFWITPMCKFVSIFNSSLSIACKLERFSSWKCDWCCGVNAVCAWRIIDQSKINGIAFCTINVSTCHKGWQNWRWSSQVWSKNHLATDKWNFNFVCYSQIGLGAAISRLEVSWGDHEMWTIIPHHTKQFIASKSGI